MNRKVLLIGGVVLVAVCLVCVVIVVIAGALGFGLTQPAADAGEKFMAALRDGQWSAAYDLCTPELQAEVGTPTGLATIVKNGKSTPKSWSFTNRQVNNDRADLSGSASFAEGSQGTISLVVTKVGNAWKVAGFDFKPQ